MPVLWVLTAMHSRSNRSGGRRSFSGFIECCRFPMTITVADMEL
jgi:hypothetical protein